MSRSLLTASVLRIAFIILAFTLDRELRAHGDVHAFIDEVTAQLELRPGDAALHLRRADLYRVDGDFDAARADLDRAAVLDPDLQAVHLSRARMWLDAGRPAEAIEAVRQFLGGGPGPEQPNGRLLLARALAAQGKLEESVREFTRAIGAMAEPGPEHFLERAEIQLAAGKGADFEEILRGLDEGIERIGPVIQLQHVALQLELHRKAYDAALRRLELVAAGSPRKEAWLVRRAEILLDAGRPDEARQAYAEALEVIEALPERIRRLLATVELERRVRAALDGSG